VKIVVLHCIIRKLSNMILSVFNLDNTYIVVITRRSVRFTPIELSKLWGPKKLVMWAMIIEISVGRKVVREKPRSLRSN
jgi:hypothetical protein